MVLSINIPLKASDEAIVKFLLGLVFSQKKQNAVGSRRECLNHDVQAARYKHFELSRIFHGGTLENTI
uniref:Uncharacterized protein n=1 Tax=Caenorhabditis japonica TaxID=281687 RepID=A0A8R1J3R6_CAEJA